MASRIVEIVGDSQEDARKKLVPHLTAGSVLLRVVSAGASYPGTERARADTVDQAFAAADAMVPPNSKILKRVVVSEPESSTEEVAAYDREAAEQKLGLHYDQTLVSLRLKKKGWRGLFGLGRTPSIYKAEVLKPAQVEISYQTRCKVVFEIGSADDCFAIVETRPGGSAEAIKALRKSGSPRAVQALERFVAKHRDLSRAEAWIRKNRSLAIQSLAKLGHTVPIENRILRTSCTAEQYKTLTWGEQLCLSDDLLEIIEMNFRGKPFGYSSFPELQFDKIVLSTIFIDLKKRGGVTNAGLGQFVLK